MAVNLGGDAAFKLGCRLRTEGGRVVVDALTSDESRAAGVFHVNDVIQSINGQSITSEDRAKSAIQGAVGDVLTVELERGGKRATAACFRGSTRSDFIEAVRSANLVKVKAILACIKSEASRAKLCQVQAPDEDGMPLPLLKLAAD